MGVCPQFGLRFWTALAPSKVDVRPATAFQFQARPEVGKDGTRLALSQMVEGCTIERGISDRECKMFFLVIACACVDACSGCCK